MRKEEKRGMGKADFSIGAFPASVYSSCESTYSVYDTAVYMIGRKGSESVDFPHNMGDVAGGDSGRHFFELSSTEEELLNYICAHFDKVIVIINTSGNAFETERITDILEAAKNQNEAFASAMLFMGGTGSTGAYGLGDVLNGTVSPSGHLVDTWAHDFSQDPTYVNFGHYLYQGMKPDAAYVEYAEGIYVGYRFYETMDSLRNDGGEWYRSAVDFPFGYGLSYTSFEQKMSEITMTETEILFDVTVTNVGDASGKEVIQIYLTPPYTGKIEKPAKSLIAFGKTAVLMPGDSETLSFEIALEDFASYDYLGEKAYVLEGGKYTVTAGMDSHNAYDAREFTLSETVVYSGEHHRSSDAVETTNRFDDLSEYMTKVTRQLTRADGFSGWVSSSEEGREVPDYISEYSGRTVAEMLTIADAAADYNYDPVFSLGEAADGASFVGRELIEMRGLDYDDPGWDALVNGISDKEIRFLIDTGGYSTNAISSINKPGTKDPDGPAGFTSIVFDSSIHGSSIPAETLIACTWNKELVQALGEAIGEEGLQGGYSGWYAPAANIHRSPFGGRNFEYYSEDPVLSGEMLSRMVEGAASKGVYCYIKHFALNDQETNRDKNNGVATWANEQAVREIYLKPFEMCIKNTVTELKYLTAAETDNGGSGISYVQTSRIVPAATAVMSSFNRVGAVWAGGRYSLLTQVLREEWGFRGMVITDYSGLPR